MKHVFDAEVAKQYGIAAAVLLENIGYWVRQNEANGTNRRDGNYWTYNSRRAYREMFPYMSARQIDTAFRRLISDGLVITGNYNQNGYDRTLWYALTPRGRSILHFDETESPAPRGGAARSGEAIPVDNTPEYAIIKDIVAYLNQCAGTEYKPACRSTVGHIKARLAEGFSLPDFKRVIDRKCAEWKGTDMAKYLRPETLFGTKFEGYLNAKAVARGACGVPVTGEPSDLDGLF